MALYTVQPGDTMFNIARRFGITVAELAEFNEVTDSGSLSVGASINVPDVLGQFSPRPGQGQSSTTIVDGFRYTLTTDRRQYSRGQTVRITFVKCNISNRTIILRYNTTQRFDIVARRGNREVWLWSSGRFFGQVQGTDTYRPGQCRTYNATWDLRNQQGNFVALDNFTLRAFNVAQGLRNRFVQSTIQVVGPGPAPPQPPAQDPCPQTNIIRDPGLEQWRDLNTPLVWSGINVRRIMLSQSGTFAAEMGARPSLQSVLSQRVNATPGRIYRIDFSAREQPRPRGTARFVLELEVFLFNRAGDFIGRIDPTFSQNSIPDNRFGRFSFTTGSLRQGTARMEIRFILRPGSSNNSSVIIDNVSAVCVR